MKHHPRVITFPAPNEGSETLEELLFMCDIPRVHGGLYSKQEIASAPVVYGQPPVRWVAWRKVFLDGQKHYEWIDGGEPMAEGETPRDAVRNLYLLLQKHA